jgi:hypothetical protein
MPANRANRIWGVCGLGFVALFATAVALFNVGAPTGSTVSDNEIVSFITDHKDALQIGSVVMALAGLAFLVFLHGLPERIGDEGRMLVPLAAGALFIGAMFAYAATSSVLVAALDYEKPFSIDPNTARVLAAISYNGLLYASIPAAVLIGAASAAATRTGTLPQWLTRAGYVGAALCVVTTVVGFPIVPIVMALWVLGVTISGLRNARAERTGVGSGAVATGRA